MRQRVITPIEDQSLFVFPQCKPFHHGGASARTQKGQEDTGERDGKISYLCVINFVTNIIII